MMTWPIARGLVNCPVGVTMRFFPPTSMLPAGRVMLRVPRALSRFHGCSP